MEKHMQNNGRGKTLVAHTPFKPPSIPVNTSQISQNRRNPLAPCRTIK
jgi:hypothetical protein